MAVNMKGKDLISIADLTVEEIYEIFDMSKSCLLYTSDAADDLLCVDLGGPPIIKKKTHHHLL